MAATKPTAADYRTKAARYYAQAEIQGQRAGAARLAPGPAGNVAYMCAIKGQIASLNLAGKAEAKAKRMETLAAKAA